MGKNIKFFKKVTSLVLAGLMFFSLVSVKACKNKLTSDLINDFLRKNSDLKKYAVKYYGDCEDERKIFTVFGIVCKENGLDPNKIISIDFELSDELVGKKGIPDLFYIDYSWGDGSIRDFERLSELSVNVPQFNINCLDSAQNWFECLPSLKKLNINTACIRVYIKPEGNIFKPWDCVAGIDRTGRSIDFNYSNKCELFRNVSIYCPNKRFSQFFYDFVNPHVNTSIHITREKSWEEKDRENRKREADRLIKQIKEDTTLTKTNSIRDGVAVINYSICEIRDDISCLTNELVEEVNTVINTDIKEVKNTLVSGINGVINTEIKGVKRDVDRLTDSVEEVCRTIKNGCKIITGATFTAIVLVCIALIFQIVTSYEN